MGLREKLNENPKLTLGIAIGVVVVALTILVISLMPSKSDAPTDPVVNKCFYSEDDGKTFFASEKNKPTPIKGPNGKDAVIAHVYDDGYGKQVVVYLEKYTDDGNKIIKSGKSNRQIESEKLVKKPGGRNWINIATEEGMKIARPPSGDMREIRAK